MARGASTSGKGKTRGSRGGKGKAAKSKTAGPEKSVRRDVYSDDEDEDKEARMNAKMDIDGVYEYEQPETFDHDSELSEDEAFDSEDEEQFGMFFNTNKAQTKKPTKGKKAAVASDEEDTAEDEEDEFDNEEEEEEEGGDLLSDMLGTAPASRLSTVHNDDDDAFDVEDDEEDDETTQRTKTQNLMSLVATLVPAKKKKKKLGEITDETISAVARARSDSGSGELTLSSLLGGGAGDDDENDGDATTATAKTNAPVLNKVKKQIRELEADAAASGPMSSTIAPVLEERASRKIAYEQKKEEVDLFQPVVRRNRQKETMDFREQIPKMENLTAAGLASKFSAETSLEKDVEALLKAGGLSDRTIAKDEHDELMAKKVSTEEVMQRQKELGKMRALMFYEEQKTKRVKKIKSKLYHKIRNNQDKKQQEKQRAQLRELDPELAKQLDEELAEKRAEERLTLKHTNTSKWVKHQLKRGINADNQTRGAIAEQLRRGDELRRKMHTVNSDDDDDQDGDDSDDDDGGNVDAATRLQRRLQKQASALVTEIDDDEAHASEVKGLAGMKFMQRAVQKQREKARSEAEKLLREINGQDGLLSDDDHHSTDDEATAGKGNKTSNKRKNKKQKIEVTVTEQDKQAVAKALPRGALQTGNVSMDKGLSARAAGAIAVDLGDGSSSSAAGLAVNSGATVAGATVQLGAKHHKTTVVTETSISSSTDAIAEMQSAATTEENPWLSSTATKNKKKSKKNKKQNGSAAANGGIDVGSAIDALAKSVTKIKSDGTEMDITKAVSAAVAGTKRKAQSVLETEQPSAVADPGKTKKPASKKAKKEDDVSTGGALTQEELVRRAFAFADEDENEIQQEKEDIASKDTQTKKGAEIAKLMGMTGWGNWAGEGVKKSFFQTKREENAKKLALETKKNVLQSRLDSKMERVLINEKKDKRAAKFSVQEVPYPFTSREEYEMAMRNPLGGDWNTPSATNALTKPKLMVRAGQMIDPLKLTKEDKKQAKKELSKKRKAKF